MNNTKIKKITKNTNPSNIDNVKKISDFKNLINLANTTDIELVRLKLTRANLCNDLVKYYIDLDISQFKAKFLNDAIENDLAIRVKGHKNSKTARPITGTAKTVISNCKKFIDLGKNITKNTTYTDIRNGIKIEPNLSENRIKLNKQLALLSDNDIKQLLALFATKK